MTWIWLLPLAHGWAPLELTRSVPGVDHPILEDLDGDGDRDLVVSVSGPTPLLWSENVGGQLSVPVPVSYDARRWTSPWRISTGMGSAIC